MRWTAAAIAFVYLYAFPYFDALKSANEVPRILLTREIVERGTFRLDAATADLGSTFDVSTTPEGHKYSNKAPGPSFLAIPAYLALRAAVDNPTLAQMTWAFRVTVATVPMLLFLWFFWRALSRFAEEERARRAAFLALALGSMALPYGILFYSHAPAMAAAGGAFLAAVAGRPALAGFLAAAAVVCDYQAILAAAVVGAYVVLRRPRDVLRFAVGGVGPAALLLYYHWAAFGSPFRTGYSFAVDPAQKQGFVGIVGPNWRALAQAFFAPSNGLLFLTPWTLLAAVGVVVGRRRLETWVCAAIAALYFLFIVSTVPEFGRGGWSVGPRYIAAAIPFLAILAAQALDVLEPRPVARTVAHASIWVGVFVHVIAATTYPHWPIAFRNPLFSVSLRALREGLVPPSLGSLVGMTGVVSLLPVYAVAAAIAVYLLGWRRTTVIAAVVAGAIVIAQSRVPETAPPDKWEFVRGNFAR